MVCTGWWSGPVLGAVIASDRTDDHTWVVPEASPEQTEPPPTTPSVANAERAVAPSRDQTDTARPTVDEKPAVSAAAEPDTTKQQLPSESAQVDTSQQDAVRQENAERAAREAQLAEQAARQDAERRDAESAIAEYRKALAIDPTFAAAYVNLADLYRARGAESDGETLLREGLARNPRTAALHYALGLSLVRQKRRSESLHALRDAANLEPDNARYAYVYAVALNDAGQISDALKVLDTARTRHPYDRNVLSALVHFTARSGNREPALNYVKQLRELDPENAEYAQMAKQIDGVAR